MTNVVRLVGDSDFKSEELLAHELGFNIQPNDYLWFRVAAFYNVYDDLRSFEPLMPFLETTPLPPHIVLPFRFANKMFGKTYGVELAGNWTITDKWSLSGGYSLLEPKLRLASSSGDPFGVSPQGNSPRHQFHVRSYVDVPGGLEFDTLLYFVDKQIHGGIPSYWRLDARLGWRRSKDLNLSVGAQNMFSGKRQEFGSILFDLPSLVGPTFYGKLTSRF